MWNRTTNNIKWINRRKKQKNIRKDKKKTQLCKLTLTKKEKNERHWHKRKMLQFQQSPHQSHHCHHHYHHSPAMEHIPSPCYWCWKREARCGEGEGEEEGEDRGDAPCCCRMCWKRRFRFSRSSIRFCWRVLRLAWNIRMSSSEMPQSPSSSSSSSHDNALCWRKKWTQQ